MTAPRTEFGELIANRSVLICVGSGGVGKTTVAASIAVAAAMQGRKSCVVTIDPARRLADTLNAEHGLDELHRIDGPWRGELYAVMLNAQRTFDDLVAKYAADPRQQERILANPIYSSLVTALGGTQEYMATEKLYELNSEGGFDLVVVDTPPSRHALDFLDAPSRLRNFLDNRVLRVLMAPGRAYLRAVSVGARLLLRSLSRVAGTEVVDDTIAFFQAFEGMDEGFRSRAASVEELLSLASTGFVLVTTARRDAVDEAANFAEELIRRGHQPDALIINRGHLNLSGVDVPTLEGRTAKTGDWEMLVENLRELATLARNEEAMVAGLKEAITPAPIVTIPHFLSDIHDVSGLELLARHLIDGAVALRRGEDPPR